MCEYLLCGHTALCESAVKMSAICVVFVDNVVRNNRAMAAVINLCS